MCLVTVLGVWCGGVVVFQSFENLEVWKLACRISVQLHRDLHDCRDFGLKDQMMTRAAVSIDSNFAEGSERNSKADFNRFLGSVRNFVC